VKLDGKTLSLATVGGVVTVSWRLVFILLFDLDFFVVCFTFAFVPVFFLIVFIILVFIVSVLACFFVEGIL
jgi:hypothetical protein